MSSSLQVAGLSLPSGASQRFGQPEFFTAHSRIGLSPGRRIFTAEFSGGALADINLPNGPFKWRLSKVVVTGGAGSGSFGLAPSASWVAHFPVSNGGFETYDVNWEVGSTIVPVAIQSTAGTAPARVCLTFSTDDWGGPSIGHYCAIFISDVEGGANATQKALAAANFKVTPAHPVGYLMFTTVGNAQLFPPPTSGIQQIVEAQLDTLTNIQNEVEPAMETDDQQSLVVNITNSAAATLHIWIFYQPIGQLKA
jgi:hypothetical protein